jgi:organic radical activating enzyme
MDKIKRFFDCYVPLTKCNFRCEYCFIAQEGREAGVYPNFKYTAKQIGAAVKLERLGGPCFFHISTGGETLLSNELIDIMLSILKAGHYVAFPTNGTLTNQFKKFADFPKDCLNRLLVSFSLHYKELMRTNNLDVYFNNIKFVKSLGCSYALPFCLYDGYVPYLNEIKDICLKELGHLPYLQVARKETGGGGGGGGKPFKKF